MEIKQKSRSSLTVTMEARTGFEQWVLLSSDRHHDSTHCNHSLELQHLKLARQRQAKIIDCGDLFDAMQGKGDKRSSYAELRPELVGRPDYFGALVDYNAAFYYPFREQFLLLGRGNHETSVSDRAGIDLTSQLADRLNADRTDGGHVYVGGYGGWVRFQFHISKTQCKSYTLKYFHGAGGDSPVTKGTIQTNRQAVYLPDADIVVNGHDHNAYYVPIARERLGQDGTISRSLAHFIRTPGYKDSYGDGSGGWDVQTGKPPKPLGCIWLRFYHADKSINLEIHPAIE